MWPRPGARPGSRRRRWLKRLVLGSLAFGVVVAAAVMIAVRTEWGREQLRAQVEHRLSDTFVGGATLGGISGDPFSELVLHDVVINGPDRKPVISVKTLTVQLGILPLLSHQARVLGLRAEDLDVDLTRDASGELAIKRLTKPGPKSSWSVDLPKLEIRRGHVRIDTGTERVNLDGLTFDGWAKLPHGGPIDAGVALTGSWRERAAAGVMLNAVVHSDERGVALTMLSARAGEVSVMGNRVTIGSPAAAGKWPVVGGTLAINATAAGVARLVPGVRLPADLAIAVDARPVPGQPWTELSLTGRIDDTPVKFSGTADLDARHARGTLSTGTLDVGRLTGGRVAGTALLTSAEFDGRPGGPGTLPIATATIRGWGEVAGVPRTEFAITLSSAGEQVRGVVDAHNPGLRAQLTGALHIAGDKLAIEDATLHATAADPARASGGKAPVHGALRIDLTARGAVRPAPSLAVQGTIEGKNLRVQDLSVSALHVSVDATQLPNRPYGRGHIQLVDLVRGEMQLGELTVDATDRADGKIEVAMRSRPKQAPWLIDADALVTPPADLGTGRVAIDLVRHRVRAGGGSDWTGTTGHIDIGPERIALRDFASASAIGSLAIAASYQRAGGRQGDLTANVDARAVSLDKIAGEYHGKVDAHAAVERRGGAWQGEVAVDGKGLSLEPSTQKLDTQARIALHGRRLTVTADAASPDLGKARLALDVDAPARVAEPAAWKRLGRSAIRTGALTLRGIELKRAAELAGLPGEYAGRVNGDIEITPAATTGKLEVSHLVAPQLRGQPIDAVLELAQPSPFELTPKLSVTAEGVGKALVQADLVAPERLFDPAAWRQLGRGALHGASVRVDDIAFDPAMLARLGLNNELRGKVGVTIDIGEAGRTLQAAITVGELRGGPIVQPIDLQLTAGADDRATTSTLTVATKGGKLVELTGKLPLSLVQLIQLRADPAAVRATPLSATAQLASIDAARLLAVFGRSEVTGGKLDGSVVLGGTLGAPTVTAKLVAANLKIPPGPHGKPVRTVERLAITGSWDGETAKLDIDGRESEGGTLRVIGNGRSDKLADGTLTIKATRFDLVPLLVFAPGPAGGAAGQLDADLRVTGLDPRTMQLAGELHLTDARIPTAPTVGTLRSARIDAVIVDHEVKILVDGKLGAGTARLDGTIALDGAAPNGGKAKLTLRKISPIGSIEPQITADIDATLSHDRNRWRADLVVAHGNVVVPSSRGEKLKPVGAPSDMVFANGQRITRRPMEREAPANPIFLVKIDIQSTRVESEEFRGHIRGQLTVRTDGEAISINGGVEAENGDLDLFSRRYYVERAAVRFDGSFDPLLDVRITHTFSDVTTITEVHGRASKPELNMSSDPGTYSQGQLLGFLLGGEPGGDPAGGMSNQAAVAGESYVANQIGGYVKKALPVDIDVLRYEAATSSSSAAITVGTWINSSLFLAYRQHLESRPDENTGEGELEYWLSRQVVIQGTAGNRGYDGVDLIWRKRY